MSELEQTHPGYIYVICQGAGIIREGRPIRGNFYCYKLPAGHLSVVEGLFERLGSTHSETLAYLALHEKQWSHRVDAFGREER